MDTELTIAELADAAGVSRRAVRFYVQEKLLPPPNGGGRGSFYDHRHLEQLRRIAELQRAGHSLDGIRRILNGEPAPQPPAPARPAIAAPLPAQLLSRIELMEGVELSFDAVRFAPNPDDLLALRALAQKIFHPHKKEIP